MTTKKHQIDNDMNDLYLQHMKALKDALNGDDSVSPAILKEAREFLKDNAITKDSLSITTFDELSTVVPLDDFEDDIGTTAH